MILLLAGDIAFSSVLLHPSRPSSIAILCLRLSLPSNARCICGLLFRIDNAISATFSESCIKRRYQPRTRAGGLTCDRTDSAGQINSITVSRCALSRKRPPRRQAQKAGDYFWPQSIPIPVPLVGHPEKSGI